MPEKALQRAVNRREAKSKGEKERYTHVNAEFQRLFDWENAIALHAMQGNLASSRGEGEVSWVFSSCGRHVGYILELRRGSPF